MAVTLDERVETACKEMRESEEPSTITNVMFGLGLGIRNVFAAAVPYVESSNPEYEFVKRIEKNLYAPYPLAGLKIVTWNVNGIRSGIVDNIVKPGKNEPRTVVKGSPLWDLLKNESPDILCLQETKLGVDMEHLFEDEGYYQFWNSSGPPAKKGYSGVSVWIKKGIRGLDNPRESTQFLGENSVPDLLLNEGRILTIYFEGFILVTVYVPNTDRAKMRPIGGWDAVRNQEQRVSREAEYNKYMEMRSQWDDALLTHLKELEKISSNVILCGDMNVMRGPLDLYHGIMTSKKYEVAVSEGLAKGRLTELQKRMAEYQLMDQHGGFAGFRLEERREFEKFMGNGFEDVYRSLYPESYGFTLWNPKLPPYRKAGNGLRLDYFLVSKHLINTVRDIRVLKELGEIDGKGPSDHAPVILRF